MPEDLTDEGNVLNAAVILDVVSGKLSLVSMPDEQITLDVYEEWSVLRSRDATCFNKDVLFGNTIRSMVNLFEGSVHEKPSPARKVSAPNVSLRTVPMAHPSTLVFYTRGNFNYVTEVDFVAHEKRKYDARPFSC